MRRVLPFAACVALALPGAAHAQRDTVAAAPRDTLTATRDSSGSHALACPASGASVRAWMSGGADSAAAPAASPRGAGRTALDTTITLAIADRTWSRANVDAGVALGAAGTAGARSAPWHACAGATAHLGTVTAHLHQVHGSIHLRADPGVLDSIGRGRSSSPTPAGPPRR